MLGQLNKWAWIALIASFLFCCTKGHTMTRQVTTDRARFSDGLTYHYQIEAYARDEYHVTIDRSDGERFTIDATAIGWEEDEDRHTGWYSVDIEWRIDHATRGDGSTLDPDLAEYFVNGSDVLTLTVSGKH